MSAFVPIIFIVLAICLALGPIMMLRPSAGDRKLANLRRLARERSLVVSSGEGLMEKAQRGCMRYSLLRSENREELAEWSLVFRAIVHEIHFYGHWDWKKNAQWSASQPVLESLKQLLDTLDFDVLGVAASRAGVELIWYERVSEGREADRIEQIAAFLEALARLRQTEKGV